MAGPYTPSDDANFSFPNYEELAVTWINGSGSSHVINHNRGKTPDLITVQWDDGTGYKIHPDADVSGGSPGGWRHTSDNTNSTTVTLYFQQFGAGGAPGGEPAKIRLFWFT